MIARPYITCEILPDGNLKLIADNECRKWLSEEFRLGNHDDVGILWEGLEGYWNNGRYYPFDASDANPFVGLTSAPCIAEAMDSDDEGKLTIEGRFWAYLNYCITSPIDELRTRGRAVFTLVE